MVWGACFTLCVLHMGRGPPFLPGEGKTQRRRGEQKEQKIEGRTVGLHGPKRTVGAGVTVIKRSPNCRVSPRGTGLAHRFVRSVAARWETTPRSEGAHFQTGRVTAGSQAGVKVCVKGSTR